MKGYQLPGNEFTLFSCDHIAVKVGLQPYRFSLFDLFDLFLYQVFYDFLAISLYYPASGEVSFTRERRCFATDFQKLLEDYSGSGLRWQSERRYRLTNMTHNFTIKSDETFPNTFQSGARLLHG
jgi:hypothetical protein